MAGDEREPKMSQTEDRRIYVAERAYELARSGAFNGIEAIKRELFAEGFGDEVRRLAGRRLRDTLDLDRKSVV